MILLLLVNILRNFYYNNNAYDNCRNIGKVKIINHSNPGLRGRVLSLIERKQGGRCRLCSVRFAYDDTIISLGHGRSYYHKSCAEKLNIT